MKSLRKLTPLFRLFFALLMVAIALLLLFKGASGPMNAQQQERQFENTIPKHVPLDVKLTKEKEKNWKDLKNENWAKDFELEVTNTGDKPIYSFGFILYFDVPNDYQDYFRADIVYGRSEISGIGSEPTAEDVPLKPGESKIFPLQQLDVKWLERGHREKGWRLPTKVKIKVAGLNFGDGTGFVLDQPVPRASRSPGMSKLENFNSQPRRPKRANGNSASATNDGRLGGQKNHNSLPAVLPVSYFRADSNLTAPDPAIPVDECEPGCLPLAHDWYVPCFGCPYRNNFWYSTSGGCGQIEFSYPWCMDTGDGQKEPCPVTDASVCIDIGPPPSPLPTPTPSPTPTPQCASCSSDAQCSSCAIASHCNRTWLWCWYNLNIGCDEHLVDDCLESIGYIPVGTCQCSHDYGGGGGGGGGGGYEGGGFGECYYSDCSCDGYSAGWQCGSGFCAGDGYCWEELVDPILIDVSGNGFALTDAANGVMFSFFSNNKLRRISWTEPQSDDAWLVLDWNKNGTIDNGKEIFSNVTPERDATESPIGFKALAMFDTRSFGGNGDGSIDQRDRIFRLLRLWQDVNHNGISEPSELHTLPELGVESISLDYRESRRRDRWGNVFRYRAKVYGSNHSDLGRWAYDVVLLSARDSIGQVAALPSSEIDRRVAEMSMFRIFDGRRRNESQ